MTSNQHNKKIARNTVYLYARMLLSLIIGLYTSRIVLRELGFVDYGLNNVVGSLLSLFTFIQGSLSTSSSRFLAFEIGKGKKGNLNKIFCMTQNIHLIYVVGVFLFAETIGLWYFFNKMVIPPERLHACFVVYQLSIFSAILSILVVPYNAMIIAQERMKAFAYLGIFNVISKLLIAFALCITPVDKLITIAVLSFILSIYIRILYVRYCTKNFHETKFTLQWDSKVMRDMLSFSGWSICSYVRIVVEQMSNLMINLFFGPTVNAARAVANTVQQNIYLFALNFQVALNPQLIKSYANDDKKRIVALVTMSQKISFSLLFMLMFPVLVNLKYILSIWLVEVPDYTESMLILICITSIFTAIGNPLGVIAEAANRLKIWNLTLMPFYLLSAVMAYILLRMGGSAIMMFILFLLFEFIALFIKLALGNIISILPILQLVRLYIRVSITILLSIAIGYYLSGIMNRDFTGFLVKSILTFLFSIVWLSFFILSNSERKQTFNAIKQRLR